MSRLTELDIQHRVFPHITRAMQGVILRSYETVKKLIDQTSTKTGLKVCSNIIKKEYETGRKYAAINCNQKLAASGVLIPR